jgi:hypothetical protein
VVLLFLIFPIRSDRFDSHWPAAIEVELAWCPEALIELAEGIVEAMVPKGVAVALLPLSRFAAAALGIQPRSIPLSQGL